MTMILSTGTWPCCYQGNCKSKPVAQFPTVPYRLTSSVMYTTYRSTVNNYEFTRVVKRTEVKPTCINENEQISVKNVLWFALWFYTRNAGISQKGDDSFKCVKIKKNKIKIFFLAYLLLTKDFENTKDFQKLITVICLTI